MSEKREKCGVCGRPIPLGAPEVRVKHPAAPNPMHSRCASSWKPPKDWPAEIGIDGGRMSQDEPAVFAVVAIYDPVYGEFADDGQHPRFLAFCDDEGAAERWRDSAQKKRDDVNVIVQRIKVYSTEEVEGLFESGAL